MSCISVLSGDTWKIITSLRFVVAVTTMRKKKNGTTNGPNLRICMDIKFSIPGIPKTYRSPWLTELLFSPALKSDESLIIPIK